MAMFRASFSGIANHVDMSYTNAGKLFIKWSMPYDVYENGKTTTQWLDCVSFSESVEKLISNNWFYDGRWITATGEISSRAFQKRDKTPGSSISMIVRSIDLLAKGNNVPSIDENIGDVDEHTF